MAKLVVESVAKEFPTRSDPLIILRDIDLQMAAGESLAIVGPSGAGKSTLLHLIGTLDTPTAGTITLDGVDPFQLSEPELARFRNENIGFIFQDHHLLPQLSVLENVLIPALASGTPTSAIRDRAGELIEQVGLADRASHLPAELSGGERERVAVARALVLGPKLLLADEPTGNLDRSNAERIGGLLVKLLEAHTAMLIVVTHSMELAHKMQQQMELDEGRLRKLAATT